MKVTANASELAAALALAASLIDAKIKFPRSPPSTSRRPATR